MDEDFGYLYSLGAGVGTVGGRVGGIGGMMHKNGAGNDAANDSGIDNHAPEPLSPMRSTTHRRNASQEKTTATPKQSYVQVADTMFPRFKPDESTAAMPQAKQSGRRDVKDVFLGPPSWRASPVVSTTNSPKRYPVTTTFPSGKEAASVAIHGEKDKIRIHPREAEVYGPSQPHPFPMKKDLEGKRFDTATTATTTTTSAGNTLRGAARRSGADGGGAATATRGMCGETLATLYLVSGLTKVSPVNLVAVL
jgi:hypothetical protein